MSVTGIMSQAKVRALKSEGHGNARVIDMVLRLPYCLVSFSLFSFSTSVRTMAQQHQLADDDNDLVSDLTCAICQELYYKPVTLIMCLHVFCASCYSQHLARQRDCPICREEVIGVRRNHTMAKIVNVFVRLNRSVERSASEKATCDLLDVIHGNIDFSSDGATREMAVRDHRYLMYPVPCRSCPADNDTGYTCPNPIVVHENAALGPSLPTSWDIPTPTGHLRCYDCERFMPARYENGEPNLLQACSFCKRTYCHLYWGCEQPERSHLGKLADVPIAQIFVLSASESNFNAPECLNDVERQFLRQFVASGGTTMDQMWAKCMSLLDSGDYICSAASDLTAAAKDHCDVYRQPLASLSGTILSSTSSTVSRLRPSSVLLACASCKIDVFWGQMFGYCQSIPRSSLPDIMTSREDCWYGLECRTQWHNSSHAMRRNHVCAPSAPTS